MTADFPDPPRSGDPGPTGPDGARQPILQVEADVAAANGMEAARDVLLRWLESRSAGGLPPGAWQGEPFTLATPEGRTADVVSRADPPLWAALLTEPAGTPDGQRWTAEASVSYAGERGRLAVRLGCTGPAAGEVVPAVPGFIRTLMRDVGLHRNGRVLSAAPTDIDSEEMLDDLIALIEDRRRDLPVIVVSSPGADAPWPLDAADLARRIAGLAWVYRLPFDLAFGLSDAFSKRWSVFQGATRLYRPGFERETQTPFDHPLLLPRRPLDPDDDAVDTLCGEVVRASIAAPGIYRRLPRFETLAAACAPLAASPAAPPAPVNEPPQEQIAEALDQSGEPEPRTRMNQRSPEEGRSPNAGLQAPTEPLNRVDETATPAEARPAKYQQLPKWVATAFADRLVLSAKAQRAAKASTYRDIATVCDALELLAWHYVDMRRNGGREQFEQSLKKLRLKDEAVAANPDRLRKDPQYWCKHEGRPVFIERHLKKGNSREPRECLRIYYAWDEDTRKVVVGHLTTHLDSEIT